MADTITALPASGTPSPTVPETAPKAETPPKAPSSTLGTGPSHGFALQGFGSVGPDESVGHNGGGLYLGYTLGVPLNNGETRFFLDPTVGFRVGTGLHPFMTLGGEKGQSEFASYGVSLGLDFRVVPSFANKRFFVSLGAKAQLGYFSTPASTLFTIERPCDMGTMGRQCTEPGAGPQTGNAGTTGLWNPHVGSARGTSGFALGVEVPISVGYDIFRGNWGSGGVFASFVPGYTYLMPNDGHGFGYGTIGGALGIYARFGGSAAEVKDDQKCEAGKNMKTIEVKAGEGAAVAAPEGVCAGPNGGWPAGAQVFVNRSLLSDLHPSGTDSLQIPSTALHPGDNTLEVRDASGNPILTANLRVPNDPVDTTCATPPCTFTSGDFDFVTPSPKPSGDAGSYKQAANATPASGASPLAPVQLASSTFSIGRIVPRRDLSASTVMTIRGGTPQVDVRSGTLGHEVKARSPIDLVLTEDEVKRMVPPGTTYPPTTGPLVLPITVEIGNASFNSTLTIRPQVATLTGVTVVPDAKGNRIFKGDQIKIKLNTTLATEHKVKVKVGAHEETITIPAGALAPGATTREYTLTMTGQPGTWADTGRTEKKYVVPVTVTPLTPDGRDGTTVNAESVTILKKSASSGHRTTTTTSTQSVSTGAPRL